MRALEGLLDAWTGCRTGGHVMRCIRFDTSRSGTIDPGKKKQPGDLEDVASDDDHTPAYCSSVPVFNDGIPAHDEESLVLSDDVPVSGEDTPAPVDDAPAVVGDDLSSSRSLFAYCCGLSKKCTSGRSISAKISSSGVLSWICARYRSVSATVASSGVLLPLLDIRLSFGPRCLSTMLGYTVLLGRC